MMMKINLSQSTNVPCEVVDEEYQCVQNVSNDDKMYLQYLVVVADTEDNGSAALGERSSDEAV